MNPEQENALRDVTRLYDRMMECGWLTGHRLDVGGGTESLQFTPAGLQCARMIADIFESNSLEFDQGIYMAFFGFIEKVAKNPP
jgi:hypothetical protein